MFKDTKLITPSLFDTEIAVMDFRMLFAGNNSIGALHNQRLNVTSSFGDPDRFFLPCKFICRALLIIDRSNARPRA